MASIQDFRKWVELACPGAPAPVIDDAIVTALREFCSRSKCLYSFISFDSVAGQSVYTLTLPLDTAVLSVDNIQDTATKNYLRPESDEVLASRMVSGGTPSLYSVVDPVSGQIRLYPEPSAAVTYKARVTLAPTQTATSVDDRMMDWYKDGVVAFAKHVLMMQPGKPWTNPDLARFEYAKFEARVGDATMDLLRRRVNLGMSVAMHPLV